VKYWKNLFFPTFALDCETIVTIWQQILVIPSLKTWLDAELQHDGSKARIAAALDIRNIAHRINPTVDQPNR
jgi:hypothetical protein